MKKKIKIKIKAYNMMSCFKNESKRASTDTSQC